MVPQEDQAKGSSAQRTHSNFNLDCHRWDHGVPEITHLSYDMFASIRIQKGTQSSILSEGGPFPSDCDAHLPHWH